MRAAPPPTMTESVSISKAPSRPASRSCACANTKIGRKSLGYSRFSAQNCIAKGRAHNREMRHSGAGHDRVRRASSSPGASPCSPSRSPCARSRRRARRPSGCTRPRGRPGRAALSGRRRRACSMARRAGAQRAEDVSSWAGTCAGSWAGGADMMVGGATTQGSRSTRLATRLSTARAPGPSAEWSRTSSSSGGGLRALRLTLSGPTISSTQSGKLASSTSWKRPLTCSCMCSSKGVG